MCTGEKDSCLQESIGVIENYLDSCGLHCTPNKCDLLVLKAHTRALSTSTRAPPFTEFKY
ncbi:hypothetical protein HPB50_017770 [Hyalomma asiaticum]|uniref:Uncharacterized protein n=1 Tax=Hyalomma asiaticum TaxID=266040 RepID=A0ACB7TPF5_HYAAI|nr:hypothetical protein HPB50_017770 [Hyalomma asiaticum]